MTMPANLFIDAPEVQDVSLTHLGNDLEQWPEEIIQKFKERVPMAADMSVMVKFMKKDEENGTATGAVIVNTSDKAAVVPVIIKDFMLFPLDVMIAKQKLLPLTPNMFQEIFQSTGVFQKIEEYPTYGGLGRFEDANLWNAIYPPSLGRYAYASEDPKGKAILEVFAACTQLPEMMKEARYPVLQSILPTISNGSSVKDWINKNPSYLVGFHKHGHAGLIKKLAHLQPVNMNEFRQGVDKLVPKSIMLLRRESPDKYSILSNSDEVFSPQITGPMSRDECYDIVSKLSDHIDDTMNEVDQNGEKMLLLPTGKDNVILAKEDQTIVEDADHFDTYRVKTNTGVTVEGFVIPKVIDFEMKPVGLKIFIGKTMSTIQAQIAGVRVENSNFKMPDEVPKVGQTGTFVYQPDESHALATVPVTIKSITAEPFGYRMVCADLMGRPIKLQTSGSMELQRITHEVNGYHMIPKRMKWVPMSGFGPVSDSLASYAIKEAEEKHLGRGLPVQVISTGYGMYSIKGTRKYAEALGWDSTGLSGPKAEFLLGSLGCGREKIAHVLKTAKAEGHAEIYGLSQPPLGSEKIAAEKTVREKAEKLASLLRRELFKEASYIDNAQTVDALLALNFVNPDNIAKFIGKIPQLKSAISALASCLLASRIGLKEIPEEAASTAMHRLIEVVDGLEKLRSAQEIAPG
jgi:hypothetical protein